MNFPFGPLRPRSHHPADFLKQLSAAGVAAWMSGEPQLVRGKEIQHPEAKADACILSGSREAWPRRRPLIRCATRPFTKGMEVKSVLSTFPRSQPRSTD